MSEQYAEAADQAVDQAAAAQETTVNQDAAPPTNEATVDQAAQTQETAWAGVSQEEWQQQQLQLAELREFHEQIRYAQQLAAQQPQQGDWSQAEAEELPEVDPYDPGSLVAYFAAQERRAEARERRLLEEMRAATEPIRREAEGRQADALAQRMYKAAGVPEKDHWQKGALIAAAAYQTDWNTGEPVAPEIAARHGASFLQEFAQAERAEERAKVLAEQQAEQERLRNLAGAPSTPAGAAGVESAYHEGETELDVARRWRERQLAQAQ